MKIDNDVRAWNMAISRWLGLWYSAINSRQYINTETDSLVGQYKRKRTHAKYKKIMSEYERITGCKHKGSSFHDIL